VREMISRRRRREERRIREAHELMRARAAATESPMKERAAPKKTKTKGGKPKVG
jgi:hypothetical protein